GDLLGGEVRQQPLLVADVFDERAVDEVAARRGQCHDAAPAVLGAAPAGHQPGALQAVDAFGHRAGGDHGVRGDLTGRALERLPRPAERGQHAELPLAEPESPVDHLALLGQQAPDPAQAADDTDRSDVQVRPDASPSRLDTRHVVHRTRGACGIVSLEATLVSVENTVRWSLVTAIAPIAWGSTYFVAHEYIPPNHPLLGAMLRALPGGLILFALRPGRPRGAWGLTSLVLGTLNVGAFMVLIYIAAQSLPSSLASTIMALSPAVLLLLAWPLAAERPTARALAGAAIGISGACLMVFTAVTDVDPAGVAASAAAMLMSSLGYI